MYHQALGRKICDLRNARLDFVGWPRDVAWQVWQVWLRSFLLGYLGTICFVERIHLNTGDNSSYDKAMARILTLPLHL